jgi:hypothetical protein
MASFPLRPQGRDRFPFLIIEIQEKIDHQQQPETASIWGRNVKRPEKGDAMQKPQKKRRVAQRGQRAARRWLPGKMKKTTMNVRFLR